MIDEIINLVKEKLNTNQNFIKAEKGTRSEVYLSNDYVIKVNKNKNILQGESLALKDLNFNFIPKIKDFFEYKGYYILLEYKILGDSLDDVWKSFGDSIKDSIIKDFVNKILSIHSITQRTFWWSRLPDKKYESYGRLLIDRINLSKTAVEKNNQAQSLFNKNIKDNLNFEFINKVFCNVKPVIVHGDLIMHNLLTNGGKITGILDWEFSQYGDAFFDLARIVYYQECAKAYNNSGEDEIFEYDFTSKLISNLKLSIEFNQDKYTILRSIFYLESLAWAVKSSDPFKNLSELKSPVFIKTLNC